jgi:hypothetical protein
MVIDKIIIFLAIIYTKMKQLSLFALFSWCIQLSFAQQVLSDGYIVELTGDTLYGYINYTDFKHHKDKLTFYDLESKEKTSYTPGEIRSFCVLPRTHFYSVTVNKIDQNVLISDQVEQVFLQQLISGDFSIYSNPKEKSNYYIQGDKGEYIPLTNGLKPHDLKKNHQDEYLLEDGTVINDIKPGIIKSGVFDKYYYDGKNIYILAPTYLTTLKKALYKAGCTDYALERDFKLVDNSFRKLAIKANKCNDDMELIDHKIRPKFQASISLLYTSWINLRNIDQSFSEKSVMLEIRNNHFDPRMSIAVGYSRHPEYDYSEVNSFQRALSRTHKDIFFLRTIFQFRPGKNIRPYINWAFYYNRKEQDRAKKYLFDLGYGIDYYINKIGKIKIDGFYYRNGVYRIGIGYGYVFHT